MHFQANKRKAQLTLFARTKGIPRALGGPSLGSGLSAISKFIWRSGDEVKQQSDYPVDPVLYFRERLLSCFLGRYLVGSQNRALCIRVWLWCDSRPMVCQAEPVSFNTLIAMLMKWLPIL